MQSGSSEGCACLAARLVSRIRIGEGESRRPSPRTTRPHRPLRCSSVPASLALQLAAAESPAPRPARVQLALIVAPLPAPAGLISDPRLIVPAQRAPPAPEPHQDTHTTSSKMQGTARQPSQARPRPSTASTVRSSSASRFTATPTMAAVLVLGLVASILSLPTPAHAYIPAVPVNDTSSLDSSSDLLHLAFHNGVYKCVPAPCCALLHLCER